MGVLESLNVGRRTKIGTRARPTGIDKRPTDLPVQVSAPGPKGVGGSGLAGDAIVDKRHHGGDEQAVYAYAREDLDHWEHELGRSLHSGMFGENLTTSGIDVTGARVGERWRVGATVELVVTTPRIPCGTFAAWLDDHGWIRRFNAAARPGAYFRVAVPGQIAVGDAIQVIHRPAHDITIATMFRALTTDRELFPTLAAAGDDLTDEIRRLLPPT